jgi:ATP-dependent RNA helicase MSS116
MAGKDVLARAKTGSGKTLGFLLPAIESVVKAGTHGKKVSILVLSPTRELAMQIHAEALELLTFHETIGAQVVYGGTNFNTDIKRLRTAKCDILIATPGRLIQHLDEGITGMLDDCSVLVLDEADRLLDMGFKPAVEKILRYVPQDRQSLMFSATVSDSIKKIAAAGLRPGYAYVDCVGDEDAGATNTQVKQSVAIAPLEDQMAVLKQLIESHCAATPDPKIMCFHTTARGTSIAAELFRNMREDVTVIHSRLSQSARTKATDQFRKVTTGVMMTSDVTARGIDIPNVTLVIQVGAPSSREQYIHRLGRTARAGKSGEGILLLIPREDFFIKKDVADLPIEVMTITVEPESVSEVNDAMGRVPAKLKDQTYAAWLGYYKQFCRRMGWTTTQLVAEANRYAVDVMGCQEVPALLRKTVGSMGLKGVVGLNIVSQLKGSPAGHQGGGGKGGGGGGDKGKGGGVGGKGRGGKEERGKGKGKGRGGKGATTQGTKW